MEKPQTPETPNHIAIIMDGNGRWAKSRGLSRSAGHREGAKTVERIAEHCRQIGVRYLTLYAFSTENWNRPKEEVGAIFDLLRRYLADIEKRKNDTARMIFLGDRTALAPDIQERMALCERESQNHTGMTLSIAVNYGGRDEILRAARKLAEKAKAGILDPAGIDEAAFSRELDTAGQPDPDLVIRPSGEMRLSNFLPWQTAYSEFVSMDVLWPDFTAADLDRAIAEYHKRSRRFGGI